MQGNLNSISNVSYETGWGSISAGVDWASPFSTAATGSVSGCVGDGLVSGGDLVSGGASKANGSLG